MKVRSMAKKGGEYKTLFSDDARTPRNYRISVWKPSKKKTKRVKK
jgi:hypothetical protein